MKDRPARAIVVGIAESGTAAAEVLTGLGTKVLLAELRPRREVEQRAARLEAQGIEVRCGEHTPDLLDGADVVIPSPGVPEHAPILRWAHTKGLPVWSELELGARLVAVRHVAVTGTNGKTTTTEMLAGAMRAAGLDAIACGNVGYPFSRAATEPHDALAVEASSFQLRFHEHLHPDVSVLLNLAPDHLDWHGSFEAYRDAKRRIYELQGSDDVHVGNRDDAHAAAISREAPCRVVWFTLEEPGEGAVGYVEGRLVARLDAEVDLGSPEAAAPSLRADAAAAAAVGLSFDLETEALAESLRGFRPLRHRGQVVGEVGGVRFVDDSKATNPHATLASIAGHTQVVLIAGGLAKGVDLAPLAAAGPSLVAVLAIGESAPELREIFEGLTPVHPAATLDEAVEEAARIAPIGGTVLLAPACASFDMFVDYAERGERFAAAVRALRERAARA